MIEWLATRGTQVVLVAGCFLAFGAAITMVVRDWLNGTWEDR